ncbi:Pentatricopeptide repeat-containing protein, chloroplastic [Glycine max]|nr:Pentatricopeptide repeat-containing protein, chloroplastic [Glycine max]
MPKYSPLGLDTNTLALSRLLGFCSHPHQGSLTYACRVFERIHHPTLCICNTIIKTFLLNGNFYGTFHVFTKILQGGLSPDNYTIPYVLKACAALRDCSLGEMVHGHVFDEIPRLSAVSWSVMISGYAKVGDVDSARLFFDEAPEKDRGTWGAMISGYVQNSCFKEGLHLFRLLQLAHVVPDDSIFVSILSACAHLGALDIGICTHRYLSESKNSAIEPSFEY